MKFWFCPFGLLFLTIFIWFSCAAAPDRSSGSPESEVRSAWFSARKDYVIPPETTFLPAEFPSLEMPPELGFITEDRGDKAATLNRTEKSDLSDSYLAAYTDGLLMDFPLAGVLGGDRVHGWPEADPMGWVQNWRTSQPLANSWGIPSLVLAVRGLREASSRVFIIQGMVLNHYGKSAGVNNANGDMGYGSPRSCEFLYEGKLAQRFDLGLITVDGEGKGAFSPGDPPSRGLLPPPDLGFFSNDPISLKDTRSAYITAWRMALDRGITSMIPDGPGQYLTFTESPWELGGGETLAGLYVQSFDEGSHLLVLPDSRGPRAEDAMPQASAASSLLPHYPRLISSPFLDVLLSRRVLPGGENLKPLNVKFTGGDTDGFARALMAGLALYGIPLTDPVPKVEMLRDGAAGEDKPAPRELQRFSRGWLSSPR